jgi:hypothetical protein
VVHDKFLTILRCSAARTAHTVHGVTEEREQISELAYHLVRAGFLDRNDAISEIIEIVDAPDWLTDFTAEAVDAALAAHHHDEMRWGLTDNDRLARAGMALEANGIVFRENFTCCQTCGFGEIADEIDETMVLGSNVRGFSFFHWQDTEGAVNGHGLCLSYGAAGDFSNSSYEAAALAVAHEITEALAREGLNASWSGDLARRISFDMIWQRRRFTAPPMAELDA